MLLALTHSEELRLAVGVVGGVGVLAIVVLRWRFDQVIESHRQVIRDYCKENNRLRAELAQYKQAVDTAAPTQRADV